MLSLHSFTLRRCDILKWGISKKRGKAKDAPPSTHPPEGRTVGAALTHSERSLVSRSSAQATLNYRRVLRAMCCIFGVLIQKEYEFINFIFSLTIIIRRRNSPEVMWYACLYQLQCVHFALHYIRTALRSSC